MSESDITHWLTQTEEDLDAMENCLSRLLIDPWFSSLWTLQEFILRRDATIISKEGKCAFPPTTEKGLAGAWSLENLGVECLTNIGNFEFSFGETKAIAMDASGIEEEKTSRKIESLGLRISPLKEKLEQSGLTTNPNTNPNVAYSVGQYRKVSNPLDRVYGITQIYGISCSQSPAGTRLMERLASLTAEFGTQLAARSPLLSQLFIHSLPTKPERSWMITQNCEVPTFLRAYSVSDMARKCQRSLCSMQVLDSKHVGFKGESTALLDFFDDPHDDLKDIGIAASAALDRHIDHELFGHSERITIRRTGGVTMHSHGSHGSAKIDMDKFWTKYSKEHLRVLLLGRNSSYGPESLSEDSYGLILSPLGKDSRWVWERIGIMAWTAYRGRNWPQLHFKRIEGLLM